MQPLNNAKAYCLDSLAVRCLLPPGANVPNAKVLGAHVCETSRGINFNPYASDGFGFHSISKFNAGATEIDDGGSDMYDGGNEIFVNDNPITYSTDCAESGAQDAVFRMNINPSAISVSVFDPVPDLGGGAGSVRIEGHLGADGEGTVDYGSFFHFSTGKQYSVFWKQVFDAPPDPSVVHLWITDAENPVHDTGSPSTDNDRDGLSGVGGATVVYMMWGVQGGRQTTRAQFESVVDAFNV